MDRTARSNFVAKHLSGYIGFCVRRLRIEQADDRLSRAASAVWKVRSEYSSEAYDMAALFDHGEWSAAALGAAEEKEVELALAMHGFTPESYNEELKNRGVRAYRLQYIFA